MTKMMPSVIEAWTPTTQDSKEPESDLEHTMTAMCELLAQYHNNLNHNSILTAPPPTHILFNETLDATSESTIFANETVTATPTMTTTTSMTMMTMTAEALSGAGLNGTTVYTNSTDPSSSSSCGSDSSFMLALPWIRITIGLLMVGENALSLLALWYVRRMVTAIHRFITSIAVAELLMGVWCCYRYSAEILMTSDSLTLECRLRFVGLTYLNFVAILSVCALCLDRCVALHLPFRYAELVTKRRVRAALALIWTLPVLFVMTAYLETSVGWPEGREASSWRYDCSFVNVASRRTYTVLTVLRCLLIAVIIVSELLIFRSARCQIIKIYPNVFSSRNSNRFLRMNAKAAITTLAVVVPFLLLYFPVLFVQGRLAVRPDLADECQAQLLAFVWLIASAHGLFAPFIFCWRFSEVRQNLVRLLRCAVRTSHRGPGPSGVFHLKTTTNDSGCTV